MVLVPMAQAPPKAGAKELPYNSLNLIHEFTFLFSRKEIVAGLPIGHQCFSAVAKATQDSPKASPRVIFKRKNLIEQLKPLLI